MSSNTGIGWVIRGIYCLSTTVFGGGRSMDCGFVGSLVHGFVDVVVIGCGGGLDWKVCVRHSFDGFGGWWFIWGHEYLVGLEIKYCVYVLENAVGKGSHIGICADIDDTEPESAVLGPADGSALVDQVGKGDRDREAGDVESEKFGGESVLVEQRGIVVPLFFGMDCCD